LRRLIINADDLGLTAGVNRGISECFRQGVVSSTTLMANGSGFAGAVETVRELCAAENSRDGNASPAVRQPSVGLSVGCHVVLVDGTPVLPPEQVASLAHNGSGEFRISFADFALQTVANRVNPLQVAAEAEAQVRRIQATGLRVSHLDTHKHVHLFPRVLKPLLLAAAKCAVRAVRNPFAPIKPLAFAHLLRRPHLWKRYSEVKLLRAWAEGFRREVEAHGMVTTDGTFGIVSTGALDLQLFRAIIGCVPEGTWELCCHPGYNDADLAQVRTRLRKSRDQEREVLTSNAARKVLEEHNIQLISYWDLQ